MLETLVYNNLALLLFAAVTLLICGLQR